MELWIRSQDKEILTKIDSILYYYDEDNNTHNIDGAYYMLGTYKTKERALEILDEIQKLIQPTFITTGYDFKCEENPFDKLKLNLSMIPTKTEIQELSTYVYEMPEE